MCTWILLACAAHALCVLGLFPIFEFDIFEPDLVPKDYQDDKEAEALLMRRG